MSASFVLQITQMYGFRTINVILRREQEEFNAVYCTRTFDSTCSSR